MPLKPIQKSTKMDPKNQKFGDKPNRNKKKDKFGRKRSQSFTGGNGKFCVPYKYRKRPMLPTKFLLGGNICDPLNLSSLQDEEINKTANAVTPKSSPIATTPQKRGHIEVIIPVNIHDPLNLIDIADDADAGQPLGSSVKKASKRRKKKKRTSSGTAEPSDADISSASEAKTPDVSTDSAKIPEINVSTETPRDLKLELSPPKEKKRKSDTHKDASKKLRRMDSMDKIVSPVIPQPGAWMKRPQVCKGAPNKHRPGSVKDLSQQKLPTFKERNKMYQFGNYNRYYGYRNPNHDVDPRLRCFASHRHLFIGKDILDIGCNIGHITLTVARDFGARSVVGLDIDKKLIGIARKNVRHYVDCSESPRNDADAEKNVGSRKDNLFPISMPILYGPVELPGMKKVARKDKRFPHNVTFIQGNYILDEETLLCSEQTRFDIILCLSVTKWFHLNWGDGGLKQAFRRMYAQLRPGGKLILEPQSWASYKHKKNLTETIYKNYHAIEFFPEKFTQYLLSSEVGFAKSEVIGHPHHSSKGFQRPIQIFTKSDLSPSQSQRSYSTPCHTITSAHQNSPGAEVFFISGGSRHKYANIREHQLVSYSPGETDAHSVAQKQKPDDVWTDQNKVANDDKAEGCVDVKSENRNATSEENNQNSDKQNPDVDTKTHIESTEADRQSHKRHHSESASEATENKKRRCSTAERVPDASREQAPALNAASDDGNQQASAAEPADGTHATGATHNCDTFVKNKTVFDNT